MNLSLIRRLTLFVMLFGLASASVGGEFLSLQAGTDRMGADYKAITMTSADPQVCRQACADDGVCKSYSYVKPGVKGANAMCFLKSSVVAAVANDCCTSGVKTITLTAIPSATSKNPSLKMANNPVSAADPQQLLKAVNDLKAQSAAQQAAIDELGSLLAQARNEIQALKAYDEIAKSGIGLLSSYQKSANDKFAEFKKNEYAQHIHVMRGFLGNDIGPNGEVLRVDKPKHTAVDNALELNKIKTSTPQTKE